MRVSVSLELYDAARDAWVTAGAATTDGSGNYGVQAFAPTVSDLTGLPYKLPLLGTYRIYFKVPGYQINLWKNSSTYGEAAILVVSSWGAYRGIDARMVPCQSSYDPACA